MPSFIDFDSLTSTRIVDYGKKQSGIFGEELLNLVFETLISFITSETMKGWNGHDIAAVKNRDNILPAC